MLKTVRQTFFTQILHSIAAVSRGEPRKSNHLHISSLYECLRKQGYELLGYTPTDDVYNMDWERAADIGNLIHDQTQAQLILAERVVPVPNHTIPEHIHTVLQRTPGWNPSRWNHAPGVEVPLTLVCDPFLLPDLEYRNLSGRIDVLFRMESGDLAVVDIKSTKPDMFASWYKLLPDKLAKWESQLAAYMYYFQMPDGERAKSGYVWMVNRGDTSQSRMYEIAFDRMKVAEDLERAEAAASALRRGELPVPEPARGPCNLCPFKTHCQDYREKMGW